MCVCAQAKLMSECSGSIDSVKRVKLILNDGEDLEDAGLTSSTASKQTSTGTQTEINAGARGLTLFETNVTVLEVQKANQLM